ncbi:monovalent cation/H(+) antiporter subunit G [Modestobacter sp. VKM Ac-2984]|uniref:monovalent cation/H(+) antiporter subunit G n=1 Tax=Modestobacter sp. VKM Ac-2984 TaxID=3004138 RepID=UPI0022AA5ABE|nr:monovalent cation/H(+) antiporter subunit G [Modestobacter sp. VKM Ac-2984]MCZ2817460.1 monovalent cation/H(+) antiporter subunit G [Modestobacter sp. VKM Ac-2984]
MNDFDSVSDWIAAACLLAGAFLCLTAGVGLLRFPDVLSRMHAGTKPQVMGVLLIMVGAAIRLTDWSVTWMLLLVAVFQMITAPVNAHMVSRIAYRRRHVVAEQLFVDELGVAPRGGEVQAGERGRRGDEPADAPAGQGSETQIGDGDGLDDQSVDEAGPGAVDEQAPGPRR